MRMHGSSKEKRRRRLTACLLLVCLLLAGCGKKNTAPAEETPAVTETPVKIAGETPILQSSENMGSGHGISVTMLNVGQGLSILVQADGQTLLYDGGGKPSKACNLYLQSHNIKELDYLVISHYDYDHIAGLIEVLYSASVKTALCPDYEADTETYRNLTEQLAVIAQTIEHPVVGGTYLLGNAVITVLGPESYDADTENNRCIAIKITYGSFSCILTGDAERTEEIFIAAQSEAADADLYVLGHHGSNSSSSDILLDAVTPNYAFLSCGVGNNFEHPSKDVLNALKMRGVELFRTDVQSIVTCYSNGERVWFSELPCDDWSDGITLKNNMPTVDNCSYVLNTRAMKFHKRDCSSVLGTDGKKPIAEYNRLCTNLSLEKILEMGYEPCGSCKPAEG